MNKNRNLLCVLSILIFVFSNAVAKNELGKSAIAVLGAVNPVVAPSFKTNFGYAKDGDEQCDEMITRKGDTIMIKTIEIGEYEIKYKNCDYLSGPVFSIQKSSVFMITYSNGAKSVFKSEAPEGETQKLHVIIKNDGTEYIGVLLKDDGREVLIQTDNMGKLYIPKWDIKSMKLVSDAENEIKYGDYWADGPFTTRYSFTTNALPIKKGESYAMLHLFGPEVHFALLDNFSMGLMTTWIGAPLGLALKYSIKTKNEKVNFGLGTILGSASYLNNGVGYGGLHWATLTYGTREQNISVSAGYMYINLGRDDVAKNGTYTSIDSGATYVSQEGTIYDSYEAWHNIKPGIQNAPSFSIAAISKVGAKASIIFDAMVFIGKTEIVSEERDRTPAKEIYTVSSKSAAFTTVFMMPGMRFQKTEKKAFQISLAGWFDNTDGELTSFPMPMVSWFYKF